MQKKTRITILALYDREGIVDDYVLHLIKEILINTTRLVIVVNGELTTKSYDDLLHYTQDVFVRDNFGYDVAAWKEALDKYVGWDQVRKYDELLLVNDSFYGPFCPLKHIYENMEYKKLDFWGLTSQYPMQNTFGAAYEGNVLPYHIQSFFLVIRKRLLNSFDFKEFWDNLPPIIDFSDAVTKFELQFTGYFREKGYLCDAYANCKRYETVQPENNYSYIMYSPYEMLSSYNYPIIKKKIFSMPYSDVLEFSAGEDTVKCLEYIENYTSYDVSMIWKNLIRSLEPGVLNNAMHMRYVLPANFTVAESLDLKREKIAVIAHINYTGLIEECLSYLYEIPEEIDIIITTKSKEIEQRITEKFRVMNKSNYRIIQIGNKGREIRGLLVECGELFKTYKYVCYVHDKRITGDLAECKTGRAYMYTLWQNMLKSTKYIQNVINLLKEKEYLGLLVPVPVYHWNYFGLLGNEWTNCYQVTKELADKLGLNCIMREEISPIALGTTFWCKTDALLPLFTYGFTEEDFLDEPLPLYGSINDAIERILEYAAQSQGYATGIVMNDEYARLQLGNYHSMINGMLNQKRKISTSVTYRDYMMMHLDEHIIGFFEKNSKVFVYGTGDFATRITRFIKSNGLDIEGYIVSDGHKNASIFEDRKVFCLSELEYRQDDIGIIVALNKEHQREVLPKLEELGYRNLCMM